MILIDKILIDTIKNTVKLGLNYEKNVTKKKKGIRRRQNIFAKVNCEDSAMTYEM